LLASHRKRFNDFLTTHIRFEILEQILTGVLVRIRCGYAASEAATVSAAPAD
jgi:hypothetical protein